MLDVYGSTNYVPQMIMLAKHIPGNHQLGFAASPITKYGFAATTKTLFGQGLSSQSPPPAYYSALIRYYLIKKVPCHLENGSQDKISIALMIRL